MCKISPLYDVCVVGDNLFIFSMLPFLLLDGVLCFTEASQFQEVPLFIVSFSVLATWVKFRKWSSVLML